MTEGDLKEQVKKTISTLAELLKTMDENPEKVTPKMEKELGEALQIAKMAAPGGLEELQKIIEKHNQEARESLDADRQAAVTPASSEDPV